MSSDETCPATHYSPTAVGDMLVHCNKPAGHVNALEERDRQHEGKVGAFPVRWRD